MIYISVKGNWGDCMVSYDNEPTWDLDQAMKFDTKDEAESWWAKNGGDWVGADGTHDRMTVCEEQE